MFVSEFVCEREERDKMWVCVHCVEVLQIKQQSPKQVVKAIARNWRPIMMRCAWHHLYKGQLNIVKTNACYLSEDGTCSEEWGCSCSFNRAGGDVPVTVQMAVNRVCPPWVQNRICYQWSCFLKGTDMFAAPGSQLLSSQLPVLAFHQFLLPEMFKSRRDGSWSLPGGAPDGKICFFYAFCCFKFLFKKPFNWCLWDFILLLGNPGEHKFAPHTARLKINNSWRFETIHWFGFLTACLGASSSAASEATCCWLNCAEVGAGWGYYFRSVLWLASLVGESLCLDHFTHDNSIKALIDVM